MYSKKKPDEMTERFYNTRDGFPYEMITTIDTLKELINLSNDKETVPLPDIIAWLEENKIKCIRSKPDFGREDENTIRFYFQTEEDAILFKLTWGEYVEEATFAPKWVNGLKV